jgi:hypothetical protein
MYPRKRLGALAHGSVTTKPVTGDRPINLESLFKKCSLKANVEF